MRILVLSVDSPFPPIGGGLMRTYQLLRALCEHHQVTLVTFDLGRDTVIPTFSVNHITVPWDYSPLYHQMMNGDAAESEEAFRKLSHEVDLPWSASYFDSKEMEKTLRRVAEEGFDVILVEEVQMGQYIKALPPDVPKVLDFHNVYSLMTERALFHTDEIGQATAKFEFDRTLRFENYLASQTAHCLVCSKNEANAVKKYLGHEHITVLPNGVDTSFFKPSKKETVPNYLLFTGSMNYRPNIDAAKWFASSILPLVQKELPDATFHVVGTNPDPEVLALASDSIIIHGRVDDVRPYYEQAEVVVVPILSGGGTRLKILEAAASGKAMVTTSLGVEGLDFSDNKELYIRDTPREFADIIIRLIRNKEERQRIEGAIREPALRYDWKIIGLKLQEVLDSLLTELSPIK